MKKICAFAILLTSALTFTGCSREQEDVFDKSAAERLNEVSNLYSQRLTSSKGGWVMEYYPDADNEDLVTGVGYLIMTRFYGNGSVYTGMKNAASDEYESIPEERNRNIWRKKNTDSIFLTDSSAWEVITDMGPVLSFNSYNKCLGRFSDPEDLGRTPNKYDDEAGKGYQGDYEFVMVDVPEGGNHILLKGKKRNVYQRLTRLPEGTDFETYLDDIKDFNSNFFTEDLPYEFVLTDNGINYQMDRLQTGRPIFYPQGKDSVAYGRYLPYLVTKYDEQYHLRFKDSVMLAGGNTLMEQEFIYNASEDLFRGVNNSGNTITAPYASAMQFFTQHFDKEHKFKFFRSKDKSDMSQKMQDAFEAASNAMNKKNKKYKIDSLSLVKVNEELTWQLRYLSGKSGDDLPYRYSMQLDGDYMTLTFIDAAAQNGQNVLNTVPEIKYLITEILSRRFKVEPYITRFNLTKIKLTSETDPNIWFVINY
jgi:hypothetical protein